MKLSEIFLLKLSVSNRSFPMSPRKSGKHKPKNKTMTAKEITTKKAIPESLETVEKMGFEKITLPVFSKGGKLFTIQPDGKPRIILHKSELTGAYRNSRKSLPDGFPRGEWTTPKSSPVDPTELDFIGAFTFATKQGYSMFLG